MSSTQSVSGRSYRSSSASSRPLPSGIRPPTAQDTSELYATLITGTYSEDLESEQSLGTWAVLEPLKLFDELSTEIDEAKRLGAQKRLDGVVKKGFDALTSRWNDEMDTLLVYAALFSAILTAFNIESYKLLQPPSTSMDDVVLAIRQLSKQAESYSISHPFVNSTRSLALSSPSSEAVQPPLLSRSAVVRLNSLWFSSLVLSLTAASLALLVKQWMYEITSGISGTSRECAQIRQIRIENLKRWRVNEVVILIPFFLQVALILFLSGLLVLLWNLHDTVAGITSFLAGLLLLIVFGFMTVAPAFRWDCSYRSPQALLVYALVRYIPNKIILGVHHYAGTCRRYCTSRGYSFGQHILAVLERRSHIHSPYSPPRDWWGGAERSHVKRVDVSLELDAATAITACTTLDPVQYLDDIRVALAAHSGAPLLSCLRVLGMESETTNIPGVKLLKQKASGKSLPLIVHQALRQMLTIDRGLRDTSWEAGLFSLQRFYTLARATDAPLDEQVLRTKFLIAMESTTEENIFAALSSLLEAVNAGADTTCDFKTVSLVFSAAEKWIETRQLRYDTSKQQPGPHVVMSAFAIVAHCCLRAINEMADAGHNDIARLCVRASQAFASFPAFLPPEKLLREDASGSAGSRAGGGYLYDDFVWGLTFVLPPLVDLALRGVDVVDGAVVEKVEQTWETVKPLLPQKQQYKVRPGHQSPLDGNEDPHLSFDRSSIFRRLSNLNEQMKKLHRPGGVEGLPAPDV